MGLEWKNNLGFILFSSAKEKVKSPKIVAEEEGPKNDLCGEVSPCEPDVEPSFLELGQSFYTFEHKKDPDFLQETSVEEKSDLNELTVNDTTDPGETWDLSLETNFLGSIFTTHKVIPTTRNFWDEVLSANLSTCENSDGEASESIEERVTVFFEKGTNEYQLAQQTPFIPRPFKLQPKLQKPIRDTLLCGSKFPIVVDTKTETQPKKSLE